MSKALHARPAPWRPTGLGWLAGLHVLAGGAAAACLLLGVFATAAEACLDALLGAELALLGIWAGLGEHSKAAGFAGVAAGTGYFSLLEMLAVWPVALGAAPYDGYVVLWYLMFFLALALLTLTAMVAASVWLRRRGVRLRRTIGAPEAADSDDVQFSMRQLMLLVFVVAVLVRLGPGVRARLNDYNSSAAMLLAVSCWSVCFAAVGLSSLWAVLSRRLSAARFAIALCLAGGLSLLPPYYFPKLLTDDFIRSAAVILGAAAIVMGSLLAVRRYGYRLAARAA